MNIRKLKIGNIIKFAHTTKPCVVREVNTSLSYRVLVHENCPNNELDDVVEII